MVIDAQLRLFGNSATSDDVTNETDRILMMHLRSMADLVITDAATAAAEGYNPSKFCEIEVWSRSGDFRGVSEAKAEGSKFGVSLQVVSDAATRIASLRKKRESILLETGPTLTKLLAENRQIDLACISVTGASSAIEALDSLEIFSKQLGLTYLSNSGHDWFNETLFARFQR